MRRSWSVVIVPVLLAAACSDPEPVAPAEPGNTSTSTTTPPEDVQADSADGDAICLDNPTAIALINGVVLTVDATDSQVSSVLVEGSRISAVGDSITVPEGACVIDLAGRTVVPGLIDSHVHFTRDWVWPGHFLSQIEDARSTQDVLDGIAARVESVPEGEYITVVGGYAMNAFALPTLAELDAVAPDHPVYLQASFSGPSAVNSLAKSHLESNGLDTIAADGSIPVDNTGRTPRAIQILQEQQTNADARRSAMEYMTWANSMGITTVIDMTSTGDAEMSEIAKRGWPLAQHSLRSAEHEAHISAFEEVNATTPLTDLHWSLDHSSEVSPSQLSRLADLGVGVGVHNFASYGSLGTGAPFRDIIDAGVTAGAGSDGRAIGPLDPWQGIHHMITGRTISGSLVNDGQQITRLEALRMYTMGSAWTAVEEYQLGSIEIGKLADLVVLDADFLNVPNDEIDAISAALTLVGGVVVYDDNSLSWR